MAAGDEKPDYLTAKQQESNLEYTRLMFLDTYALVLFKQGKVEEAVASQEQAIGDGRNSAYNERYLQFLIAAKDYKKAAGRGADFISINAATAKAKEYFKEAFLNVNPSVTAYNNRLTEVEKAGLEAAITETRKSMLNEEAPAFELVDLEGERVSLTSLRGKTVILDFWATWCGPCVQSFPGMQLAVDKYANDPNVVFLFVNTMENTGSRNEDVKKFIEEKAYTFHVVMDETENKNSNSFKVASAYNVSGIPTKVIIGPDGKLRFKKMGYNSNTDHTIRELDIMIGLLNGQYQEVLGAEEIPGTSASKKT